MKVVFTELENVLKEEIKRTFEEVKDDVKTDTKNPFGFVPAKRLHEDLGVSVGTVNKWVGMGLKKYKVDKLVFFKIEEVNKFIAMYRE